MKQKRICLTLISCILLTFFSACGKQEESVSRSGFYFNTIITITLYNTSNEGLIDQCFQIANQYEQLFSNTLENSDISRINANAGEFVEVDEKTVNVIQKGIHYGKLSDGFFDITIGPLSGLWNISQLAVSSDSDNNEVSSSVIPQKQDLLKALTHIDYKKILISGNQVKLTDKKARLDLGGIAKGYIADEMKAFLNEQGITTGIINLGGNVLTLGPKADQTPYSIGIQKPFADQRTILGTLKVKNASVVSSGIYERYITVNNQIYHHIIDPTTGYPVENELWQVTIISQSSIDGDALSTTCFALGTENGLALVESLDGVEAIFVSNDGTITSSSGIGTDIQFIKSPTE